MHDVEPSREAEAIHAPAVGGCEQRAKDLQHVDDKDEDPVHPYMQRHHHMNLQDRTADFLPRVVRKYVFPDKL